MISIIIPIYNIELYIVDCLDSVLSQTYSDWEAILVDDGSTDESGEICEEYLKIDNRFKVIHKEHEGLSSARNAGLRAVVGEYISFVDGDDILDSHFLEVLHKIITENTCDISMVGFIGFNDTSFHPQTTYKQDSFGISFIKSYDYIVQMYRYDKPAVVWNKLYKRDVIEGRFFADVKRGEDWDFHMRLFVDKNLIICYSKQVLYMYRLRLDSLTRGYDTKWNLDDLLVQCNIYYNYLEYNCGLYDYTPIILSRLYRNILNSKMALLSDKQYVDYSNELYAVILDRTYNNYKSCKGIPIFEKIQFKFFYRFIRTYKLLVLLKYKILKRN